MATISEDIREILEKSVNDELDYYEVTIGEGNKAGEGFMSDMVFVSLKSKRTGKNTHLVIKQTRPSSTEDNTTMMSEMFFHEIQVYTKILPAMINFQKSLGVKKNFNHIPLCYAASDEAKKEKLVLENLKFQKYQVLPKTVPIDTKTYTYILKIYGKLHGLSFAFQHTQPEKFKEVTSLLVCSWAKFSTQMPKMFNSPLDRLKQFLKEDGEEKLMEKFLKYFKETEKIFTDSVNYRGKYPVLIHGDSWSNNMMFKYDSSGEFEDAKLVDFQTMSISCAVLDLSYCIYAGASKDALDNLEQLLEVYYESLSETLKELNCNPEEIYPFEELKKEWKEYCKFGYLMAIYLWSLKTTEDFTGVDFDTLLSVDKPEMKMNDKLFKEMTMNLTKHMYENGFL